MSGARSENLFFPEAQVRPAFAQTTVVIRPRDEIFTYEVRGNDTLSAIAAQFGLKLETLLWANDIAEDHVLHVGDTLRIPPIDGVIYTVKAGDTLQAIAAQFQGDVVTIAEYNRIGISTKLAEGMTLVIPNGVLPEQMRRKPARTVRPRSEPTVAFGEFRWPTRGVITQYFAGGHTGLDIANRIGTPIAAADAGRVIATEFSRFGYGNRIVIDHGNGWVTTYNHLSQIGVRPGDYEKAGEIIGAMGSTGWSSGPHLHFEALYNNRFVNPLNILR